MTCQIVSVLVWDFPCRRLPFLHDSFSLSIWVVSPPPSSWRKTDSRWLIHLLQEGIAYTVFEQDATPHARPRDWNYGIYWAQSHLDECLPPDLMAQVPSCQVDSHVPTEKDAMPIFNGETGERIIDLPAPYSLRLKRRKFLKLISTGLDIKVCPRQDMTQTAGLTL